MSGSSSPTDRGSVVALCGGVGGAKLALGLSHVVPADKLSIIVNTGDDFRHLGLHISPDIDTVLYTLSGLANPETGWGRKNESWRFMTIVGELGGETWFNLGDTDLALHAVRTARLERGDRLTTIVADIAAALGIGPAILPASDHRIETIVETDEGPLPFQRYFVQRKCAPKVSAIRFDGANIASLSSEVESALARPDLSAIVICPSNPYLSVDPMLAIPGFRSRLKIAGVPIVAVSPLVGGRAIKGPLAKIMTELGRALVPGSVLDHYDGLLDVLLVDRQDTDEASGDPRMRIAETVMSSLDDRIALARAALAAAADVHGTAR